MTRQEAKKVLCGHLLATLSAGQMEEIVHDFYDYSEADQQRLTDALEELMRELHRRAN